MESKKEIAEQELELQIMNQKSSLLSVKIQVRKLKLKIEEYAETEKSLVEAIKESELKLADLRGNTQG